MVLGGGLVAGGFRDFADDQQYLIFAAGVSNSSNTARAEFERERKLLVSSSQDHSERTLVYFSTCSIYDPSVNSNPYVQHKLAMEKLVAAHPSFHIFRISNLVGRTTNPHTLLNFIASHIKSGTFFHMWKHAARNVIDLEDAASLCKYILKRGLYRNAVINIANPFNYSVPEIVAALEAILGKSGHYDLVNRGGELVISTKEIQPVIKELGLDFEPGYLGRTIQKYYSGYDL
jgi:nucleoside-diphosphate-sugar epimerase